METKKILIVDDEKDTLTVLAKRLLIAGYQIIEADGAQKAIEMAKLHRPDLILLDIMMPGMDGTEVKTQLKNDPHTKDIPVIFLTSLFTKKDEQEEGHKIAGSYLIAKPYEPAELVREIEKQLFEKHYGS